MLQGVEFELRPGEVLGLLGRNGMGKSTLLKVVMGLVRLGGGEIMLDGTAVQGRSPAEMARAGVGYVPQGRELFADLSVRQNIRLARIGCPGREAPAFSELGKRFPVLTERADEIAGRLSGGQQQQVALARALAAGPRFLLLDEPSEGIQPSLVLALAESLVEIARTERVGVVLVEQNLELLRRAADHCAVLEKGRIVARYAKDEMTRAGSLERHLARCRRRGSGRTMQELLIFGLDTLNFVLAIVLVALGLVIIFGLMRVINMAHGEFFLIGAYSVVTVQTWAAGSGWASSRRPWWPP